MDIRTVTKTTLYLEKFDIPKELGNLLLLLLLAKRKNKFSFKSIFLLFSQVKRCS